MVVLEVVEVVVVVLEPGAKNRYVAAPAITRMTTTTITTATVEIDLESLGFNLRIESADGSRRI